MDVTDPSFMTRIYWALNLVLVGLVLFILVQCPSSKRLKPTVTAPKIPKTKTLQVPESLPESSPIQSPQADPELQALIQDTVPLPNTCPSYASDTVHIVQPCDGNLYNVMSDVSWAVDQDPQNFSYMPATSIPGWTQQTTINQMSLYTPDLNQAAGLDTTLEYQTEVKKSYLPGYDGYLLADPSSGANVSVEDLYANFWMIS